MRFFRRRGLATVEFALLALLIALAIAALVAGVGGGLRGSFQKVVDAFSRF